MLCAAALGSCVLVDPPATLPVVPEEAPSVTASTTPPEGPLLVWPRTFIIPIRLVDTSRPLVWQAFIDYDPNLPSTRNVGSGTILSSAVNLEGVVQLQIALAAPVGLGCHTLTVIVAYGWSGNGAVPDSTGGAEVVWEYRPGGQCNGYDAGVLADASFKTVDSAPLREGGGG